MAKTGKSGLLIAAALGLGAFALLRQGQASATTLSTARLERFELKGLSGTSLKAVAHVQFSNTDVNRDTALQALGLNVLYNDTVISTVHFTEPQTLPANQNTTVGIPMTLNMGSLLTQMALTGKVPPLSSLKSVGNFTSWLRDKVAPESFQMQGSAKIDGLVVRFDQPLPLENYLPSGPRPTAEATLPTRRPNTQPTRQSSQPTVRPATTTTRQSSQPTGRPATTTTRQPTTSRPAPRDTTSTSPVVRQQSRVVQQTVTKGRNLRQVVTKAMPVVRDSVQLVRQAASTVQNARRARPTTSGRPTASKARQPAKPPTQRKAWDAGLPKVNLPTTRRRW